jgi:hypothetical protein
MSDELSGGPDAVGGNERPELIRGVPQRFLRAVRQRGKKVSEHAALFVHSNPPVVLAMTPNLPGAINRMPVRIASNRRAPPGSRWKGASPARWIAPLADPTF